MISIIHQLIQVANVHRLDINILKYTFIEASQLSFNDLYTDYNLQNNSIYKKALQDSVYSIKNDIPIARMVNYRYFHESYFYVSPFVFDPRSDTAILVDMCLEEKPQYILDIGTGSGAILISILNKISSSIAVGYDTSIYALHNALHNALKILKSTNIRYISAIENEILDNSQCIFTNNMQYIEILCNKYAMFDVIVSNPPYIRCNVSQNIKFDPPISLYYQNDMYPSILDIAQRFLKQNGLLMLEIPQYLCDIYLKESKYFSIERINQSGDVVFVSLRLNNQ